MAEILIPESTSFSTLSTEEFTIGGVTMRCTYQAQNLAGGGCILRTVSSAGGVDQKHLRVLRLFGVTDVVGNIIGYKIK